MISKYNTKNVVLLLVIAFGIILGLSHPSFISGMELIKISDPGYIIGVFLTVITNICNDFIKSALKTIIRASKRKVSKIGRTIPKNFRKGRKPPRNSFYLHLNQQVKKDLALMV